MTTAIASVHTDPAKRHDFVLLFDVQDGNPNGDPDAGNAPRLDPDTLEGLVTDVAIKRKVRDFVDVARGSEQRYKIYVQRETYLTETRARIFGERAGGRNPKEIQPREARDWMCDEFYDVRMFGAVMSMKESNAGQVRGPLQLTFARSVDPIFYVDNTIGRVALERGERPEGRAEGELEAPTHGTLGRKSTVRYGLYRTYGFFNANFAKHTGVTSDDLDLFWQALELMWDHDRSASRGLMASRGLYVFTHDNALGNTSAQRLFESVSMSRKKGVEVPRGFGDYSVTIDEANLPPGVTLTRLVG